MRPSRPRLSPAARRILVLVHRWFGVVLGFNLAALCLTGAILLYEEDIDARLNPALMSPLAQGTPIGIGDALAVYRAAHPNVAIDRIYFPNGPVGSYRLRVGPKDAQLEAFVDPYRAVLLGERVREDGLLRKLELFHTTLLWPKIGRWVNGFVAFGALWMVAAGLLLWWPTAKGQLKARLSVKRKASAQRRNLDLHNVIGVYSLPVLALILLTGATWAFDDFTEPLARRTGTAPVVEPPKAKRPSGGFLLDTEKLLQISTLEAPGSHVVKYMLPTTKNRIVEVHREWSDGERFGNRANVWIDAENGKVVAVNSSRRDKGYESAWRWIRPLHEGLWGADFSRLAYALAGLAPACLIITGLTAFFFRKRARKRLSTKRRLSPAEQIDEDALPTG
jgi:uncharacterized iron-regulated membrane protein